MSKIEDQDANPKLNKVSLSAPWRDRFGSGKTCLVNFWLAEGEQGKEGALEFVRERTRLHELYIKEKEKTKRIYLSIAAFLFVSSLLVIVFAPDGREIISYWIGATLLLFSAGAAGFTQIKAKGSLVEFSASDVKNENRIDECNQ